MVKCQVEWAFFTWCLPPPEPVVFSAMYSNTADILVRSRVHRSAPALVLRLSISAAAVPK
jgi:hypothetical protein